MQRKFQIVAKFENRNLARAFKALYEAGFQSIKGERRSRRRSPLDARGKILLWSGDHRR